ncbi:MAG: hypothetical protein KAV18_04375 [Candidatus Omnitrophica bacterium]|nr:hypothetical protein [Candidatus Omnitrophota bacterium]MCK4423288.1 hypothetical protein [Candidatus Omnitrophota bacterium]
METNTIIGLIIIGSGLALLIYLMAWSLNVIERIARNKYPSLRDILKDIYHG